MLDSLHSQQTCISNLFIYLFAILQKQIQDLMEVLLSLVQDKSYRVLKPSL